MPSHLFILLVKRSLTGAYRQPIRKFKNNSAYRGFMEEMGRPLYTFKGDGGYIGIGMSMAASEAHQAAENNEPNGPVHLFSIHGHFPSATKPRHRRPDSQSLGWRARLILFCICRSVMKTRPRSRPSALRSRGLLHRSKVLFRRVKSR